MLVHSEGADYAIASTTGVVAFSVRFFRKSLRALERFLLKLWRVLSAALVVFAFRVMDRVCPAVTRTDYSTWLIGGSNGWYYDGNAAVLFEHIRKKHPEIKIYWVMKRRSAHWEKVRSIGPVIAYGSLKSLWLSMKAGVIISTHSRRSDIADIPRRYCRRALAVHLFHGVTALKRKAPDSGAYYAEYDLLIATGPREREIKKLLGCPEERLVVTGFPQHDRLPVENTAPGTTERQILFLPTWRSWLAKMSYSIADDIREIDENYFKPILDLITQRELVEFCNRNRVRVRLMIHRNMQFWWRDFVARYGYHLDKYVDVLSPEASVQQELIAATILVTDYSSVAWEFLYMMKPVVFYTFDLDRYLREQGSYLRLPDELFGPYTTSPALAAQAIIDYMEAPERFAESDVVRKMRRQFFSYIDNRNSERVVREINKRLREKRSID